MPPVTAPAFLRARWMHLAMANYEVDPGTLRPLVPRGTELDYWGGRCFVSVVGFQFLKTRVLGLSVPWHRNFLEVNLRFYVRREAGAELKRGVVFVKEIVPRRAIAWIANALYNEKYVALPMSHHDELDAPSRRLRYEWRHRGEACCLAMALSSEAALPAHGSFESFITEHYWGYTAQRDGSTLEYQVEHPAWRVWHATQSQLICDVPTLYGPAFAPFLSKSAESCFVAEGSEVLVRRGRIVA